MFAYQRRTDSATPARMSLPPEIDIRSATQRETRIIGLTDAPFSHHHELRVGAPKTLADHCAEVVAVTNIPPVLDRWMFANPVSFRAIIRALVVNWRRVPISLIDHVC